MRAAWNPWQRVAPYPLARQRHLAERIGALLSSTGTTLLVPGEAIVALEAVARGLGRPGVHVLNVVTSPYGSLFGQWLTQTGADVLDVVAAPGLPIETAAVHAALGGVPSVDAVVVVHGEAASGVLNPLDEIATLAHRAGAIVVVDAVASFGAHPLDIDRQGLDIVVTGPQKALGGPASVSAVTVNARAQGRLARGAVQSSVSLPPASGAVPLGTSDPLSLWALEAALDAVEHEGLAGLVARHTRAAAATRAGLRALDALWITDDDRASHLVTTARVPAGIDAEDLLGHIAALDPHSASPGIGGAAAEYVRLNHTGSRASFASVLAAVTSYAKALDELGVPADVGVAARRVVDAYSPTHRRPAPG